MLQKAASGFLGSLLCLRTPHVFCTPKSLGLAGWAFLNILPFNWRLSFFM